MEAYCLKCKSKREMVDAQAIYNKAGAPATTGTCRVCGTKLYKMGYTPAHEGLKKPPAQKRKSKKRSGNLVIVESPAKARTVGRFLNRKYSVKASVGHVRDLLRSQLSVDVDNNFSPKYRVPNDKRPVVKELKALAKNAKKIYLATDPDREGEAIAWHLMEAIEADPEVVERVVFHEITGSAVSDAFSHTRHLNMDLVDAQQARRVLDRLVGYKLSPLLWRKVRGRLSAGRVQSVALRLVVEREREIEAFVPEEYWSISAKFLPEDIDESFVAKLTKIDDRELELTNEGDVKPILNDMERANYVISQIKRGVRKRKPAAPFTTSTLQQDASRRLGFTARRTMSLAQQLYEGIDIGNGGQVGLITYMRTDSTNVSKEAQLEARNYILERYGESYCPSKPPVYKTKSRTAQEAHEAVRPTSILRRPVDLKARLTRDQLRLYRLIWERFLASQMAAAIYDTLSVRISGQSTEHTYRLRASGSTLRFQGFLRVYEEAKPKSDPEEMLLPIPKNLRKGQILELLELIPEQHFTQPPPRFSEASLVSTLEENGIGRPSTYAPILNTLQQRGYVTREGRRLFPTDTGYVVTDLLIEHFPDVLDVGFTAIMEGELDRIAEGDLPWTEAIREFYSPFAKQVELADQKIPKMNMGPEPIGRDCPRCDHDLVIRWGRYGKFISCSNFPNCRYTEQLLEKIGVNCPQDGGDLVERKSRKGRTFYGCANYPECDFSSWKRPLATPCPNCGGLLVIAGRNTAQCLSCEESFQLESVVPAGTSELAT